MSDNDIIARIREGDHEVTTQTYQRYRKEFIRWMKKKYRCPEDDAQDLYQGTFLTFYTQITTGKLTHITASIKTYLFGIGKNKFYEQQRTNTRFEHDIDGDRMYDYDERTDQQEEREILYRRVEEALRTLSQSNRQMLMMVYYENRSMEYITEKLGYKNAASTKNQKYKCMERIRKMLETIKKTN